MGVSHRNEINELALEVGRSLGEYIVVHNAIFQEASTLKSVLKNLLGRGLPMSKLLEDAEALKPTWAALRNGSRQLRERWEGVLSTDEQRYMGLHSDYVAAVSATVDALVDRQRLLNEGSRGGAGNAMTWPAFREKERAYQAAVQRYMAIGAELNDAAPVVFKT